MNFTPIFASNMDGVGTFSMAKVLQEYKMMTVVTKSTTVDQIASIRIFIAVAEAGALNGAARQMEISPSAVSKHIAALENRLGAQLLNRTTRQVALTEVGTSYLKSCRLIIAELDKANSEARTASGSVQGLLHVGAPIGFAHRHVAPHLPSFITRFPDVEVLLLVNDRIVDLVDEGIDLAIRISVLKDSSLIARKLANNVRSIVAAPEYLARHGRPHVPDELTPLT